MRVTVSATNGVAFAMKFLSDLTEAVPCRALSFKPDASIVDFLKAHGSRHTAHGRNSDPMLSPATNAYQDPAI